MHLIKPQHLYRFPPLRSLFAFLAACVTIKKYIDACINVYKGQYVFYMQDTFRMSSEKCVIIPVSTGHLKPDSNSKIAHYTNSSLIKQDLK